MDSPSSFLLEADTQSAFLTNILRACPEMSLFEHLPVDIMSPPSNVVDVHFKTAVTTKRKKSFAVTKEIPILDSNHSENGVIAVPKNLVLPTPSTPIRHLFKTPITLTVGPQAHPFPLHLEALLACSPFFTAAFNPHYAFRESLESTLHLKEINVVDFEYFTQWLYRRSLEHESLEGPHPAYFRLIKLWKVADVLQVPSCKNAIIDTLASIADATNSVPTPDDTHAIFDDDVGEDMAALGSLTLDLFVWKKTGHLISTHPDSWHERFLRRLVVQLKDKRDGKEGPWVGARERCKRYHVHDDWAPEEFCRGGGKGGDGDGWVKVERGDHAAQG
ncbi:hypothetical protein ACLMJK_007961 [Lecanora helva]